VKKIEAIIRPEKLNDVKNALADAGIHGMNFVHITGRGEQLGIVHQGRGGETVTVDVLPKVKIETVVREDQMETAINAILASAGTGTIGDGKIFISEVEQAIRVRTGERGSDIL
jgi:nitrogen regulatory protein P-II 1